VFELLVEYRPRGTRTEALRGGVASFVVHSTLIAGAVVATIQTTTRPDDPHRPVPLVFTPYGPEVAAPPSVGLTSIAGPTFSFRVLAIPAVIPGVIPPPATVPVDPTSFTGVGPGTVRSGVSEADTAGPAAGTVYTARVVDERPELLSHPGASYPEILRQAGIGGRVMIEAVIDTSGRVERGSIRVLAATHPLFGPPAMTVVSGSIYRPGRIDGRAVRVRVQIPIEFAVTALSAGMLRTP
jgi:protein TonB